MLCTCCGKHEHTAVISVGIGQTEHGLEMVKIAHLCDLCFEMYRNNVITIPEPANKLDIVSLLHPKGKIK